MKYLFTIGLFSFTLFSCNSEINDAKDIKAEVESLRVENEKLKRDKKIQDSIAAIKTNEIEARFLISDGEVGEFKIENILNSNSISSYKVEKAIRKESIEGDVYEYPILELYENGVLQLTIQTTSESKNDFEDNPIQEISIFTNEYKTKEGIGVGSTIKEFFETYPSSKIYHYVETNRYCIRNNSTTYYLLPEDFTGEIDWNKQESHLVANLSINDFKLDSKISKITVY